MNSPKPEKVSLRERFRQESTREILAAAEAIFVSEGLAAASMSQIAERAGVAVGTLYNRFQDREALLQALLAQRRAELLERLDATARELSGCALRERLLGVVQALLVHGEVHRPFLRLVLASEWGHGPSKEHTLHALRERLQRVLAPSRAELCSDDPEGLPVLLIALVRAMLERDRFGLPTLPAAAAARQVVQLFLEGAQLGRASCAE